MKSLKRLINKNKFVYKLYINIGSLFVNILGSFIRKDEKTIIFVSYSGKFYNDSPKSISDAILNDKRFDTYKIIWAFENPKNLSINKRIKKVKIDTIRYYYWLSKSYFWITNVSVLRKLNINSSGHYYINTWHGIPIKKIGFDIINEDTLYRETVEDFDCLLCNSKYDKNIFSNAFRINKNKIFEYGIPRNDILYSNDIDNRINSIKEKYNVENNKKIILYAPTFRDDSKKEGNLKYDFILDLERWEIELSKMECVLLLRLHPAVIDSINGIDNFNNIKNVSYVDDINELYVISDILISDYSSVFFDYSILERPMICFAYDIDTYVRGLYVDLYKMFKINFIKSEEDLLKILKNHSYDIKISKDIKEKYINNHKNSTEKCLNLILNDLTLRSGL